MQLYLQIALGILLGALFISILVGLFILVMDELERRENKKLFGSHHMEGHRWRR